MKKVLEHYYRNGKLQWRENYLNGKSHGVFKQWFNDGNLNWRINYLNAKLHGLCEGWYIDGKKYIKDYHLK